MNNLIRLKEIKFINDIDYALCSFRDFTKVFNPIHGNCYVFNSGWNSSIEVKTSTKSGRRHGK